MISSLWRGKLAIKENSIDFAVLVKEKEWILGPKAGSH
jgi:hypothetical protein